MSSTDRREIARLLRPHFPSMPENATSDDWGAFLDKVTGLTTPLDQPNGTAFDNWRQALAAQGYPVWVITEARKAEIAVKLKENFDKEAKNLEAFPEMLKKLRKDAPLVTAAELMNPKKAKP